MLVQIKKVASTLDTLEVSHDFAFELEYRLERVLETGLDAAAKPAVFEDNRSQSGQFGILRDCRIFAYLRNEFNV